CQKNHKEICGQVLYVPVLEAPGQTAVGRFGWKDQHASLLSFSADAYLNEMGITSRLQPDEVTNLCNTVSEPNDKPGPDGLSDIDSTGNQVRTPPLWGVRLHSRLMHDGASVTLLDAILRHHGEAEHVTKKFERLKPSEKDALLEFLRSL